MHDWVIRGGTVIDGTGRAARTADVAFKDGRIQAVGRVGPGQRELNADGLLVTPGFVDVHTHYDAQVTWDPELTPSSRHGVTTVVMGNCGVVSPPPRRIDTSGSSGSWKGWRTSPAPPCTRASSGNGRASRSISTRSKAEPEPSTSERTFPTPPLRAYVMRDRSLDEEATGEDIEAMAALVRRGLAAGAMGFSTSRTLLHKSIDGEPVPGTFAASEELFGLGRELGRAGRGVFQMAIQHEDLLNELTWARALADETGRPVMFNLSQVDHAPDLWRDAVEVLDAAERDGAPLYAQVAGRAIGIVMGFHLTAHPFALKPSFLQIMHDAPEEKQRALRDRDLQRKLLSEEAMPLGEFETFVTTSFDKMYPMGEDFDYEPAPELSIAARAQREGRSPAEVALDHLLADDTHGQLYFPLFNYSNGALDHLHVLHQHDRTLMGLSDAGAHCGAICDGGMPTFMLTHWTRDRTRGPKLPLERVIQRQTRDTARHFGLLDRGVLAPGMKADLNVIDYPRLGVGPAEVVYDLPAGGRRLLQRAHGYRATFKSGQLIVDGDALTGALPGRLLRAGTSG